MLRRAASSSSTAAGEPVYGDRDHVNVAQLRELGVPFWLAGGYGSPEKLRDALDRGRRRRPGGHRVCLQRRIGLAARSEKDAGAAWAGTGEVFTDPLASPTGFPFKVAQLEGTSSALRCLPGTQADLRSGLPERGVRQGGWLHRLPLFRRAGSVLRLAKGGKTEDTVGRKCLCNSLLANIGHPQIRKDGTVEPPLVTVGDDLKNVARFLGPGRTTYTAAEVVESLLSLVPASAELPPAAVESASRRHGLSAGLIPADLDCAAFTGFQLRRTARAAQTAELRPISSKLGWSAAARDARVFRRRVVDSPSRPARNGGHLRCGVHCRGTPVQAAARRKRPAARSGSSQKHHLPLRPYDLSLAIFRPSARHHCMDGSFDFGVRAVWSDRNGTGLDFGDRVASALGFLSFHRECRAEVLCFRLGIDAAGGGLLHCIPRARAHAALASCPS